MAAKFVLKKGSTGKFSFSLVATNGQVIATSEADESKASAVNGIESVKRNAADAAIDDQTDNSPAVSLDARPSCGSGLSVDRCGAHRAPRPRPP